MSEITLPAYKVSQHMVRRLKLTEPQDEPFILPSCSSSAAGPSDEVVIGIGERLIIVKYGSPSEWSTAIIV